MYQQHSNKLSSKGERKNKYHIRKFSAGIASVLFGSLVYINSGNIAEAAENEINQTASAGNPSQATMVEQPNDKLTAENNDNATQNSQAVKSQETPIDDGNNVEIKENTSTVQPVIIPRAVPETSAAAHPTVAAPPAPVEAEKTTYHAPAPEAKATAVAPIEGINEQVYSKEVDYYPASKVAKTAEQQRGIYQARESLGLIVPAGKNFYIRQAQGSNQTDLRVDLMTDDSPLIRNANVSKNGKWTHISTTTDSAVFLRIPAGLNKKPVVEYYVEGDAGITLPTFRKNGNQQEFVEDWKKHDTSYGYVDGDKIAFLIPRIDRERIANLGAKPGRYSFHSLEEMIEYYEDIINHYDRWVGLNDDINSIHYNVPHKYFTIADKRGFGLAYYSTNNMGSNSPSMYGYLEKGWLSLHEVGHGYDGAMTGDGKMELIEVENNILANQYQTTVMGINDGWLYEGRQDKVQKGIHDQIIKANGTFKFGGSGFRDRLDFMTKMVRLTGIDGFTDLWKGIREEEAALTKLNKPFNQDVPRWINTFWLAEHGVNGTAYFDLYNIPITQGLKNELSTYNNSFAYPLAMLIDNPEEQKRLKDKLNLSSIYELVKSADLADTELSSNAEIILNLNGQTLPADVKVSLLEGGKEVAQAKVEDGKAVFPAVKPGVYKIAVPLSIDNALPASQYLIVREKSNNQAVLDYPKHNTTQAIMTQKISLRGLGNLEFAYVDYNPEKKTVKFVQNSGQPHLYFSDEYAHLKIEKADGTVLLDESFVGNHNLKSKVQDFNLEYGDKITVRHREQAARRAVVRKETNEDINLPNKHDQTVTYVLTDKGFTVNAETQADADRRYDEAIQGDTERLVLDIKAHPERDYRIKLFHVTQGVKFASPDLKTELEIILTPLAEKYYVSTPTIEPIEAGADTLSGKGDPESTITVTLPNRQIVKTEVDKDGNWKVQLSEGIILKHNDVTLIKATGELGSVSKDVTVTAVDTQAPAQPVINHIEAGSTEINGTSEPESLVIITLPDNQKVESTTDKQGNWKVTLGTPLNHGQNVKAEAQDAAGNKSIMASQIVEDTISPVKPVIQPIEAGTNHISGTSEPNSTVTLSIPEGKTLEVLTDAHGNWEANLQQILNYNDEVKAVAKDVASNTSSESGIIVKDTKAPAAPVIKAIEAGSTEISGTSEPNSTVVITLPDNKIVEVQADAQGNWKILVDAKLKYGEEIKAVAKDLANNKSSEATQIVKDTQVPTAPVIKAIEAGSTEISGTSEPNNAVIITIPGDKIVESQADDQGNWKAISPSVLHHNDEVSAVAKDVAQNESSKATQTVKDTVVPTVPVINIIEVGSTEIRGISESNSTVIITLPDNKVVEVQADAQGNWKATLPSVLHHNDEVSAIAKDTANNESSKATQIVKDTQAPTTPVINAIEAGSTEIGGTSEPNSTVVITMPDNKVVEVQADAQGNWKATLPSVLHHNDEVSAIAKDTANNESSKATQTVKDTKAPTTPVIKAIEAGSTEIGGTSEPNSKIIVYLVNNKTVETQSDTQGNWKILVDVKLKHGEEIKAVAKDLANNESSKAIQIVKDTIAPAIPSIEPVKESDKKIEGLADPFTIIHVELSANSPILIETDASGKWEYYLNEEQKLEGNTLIKVFATDKAENKSAQNESLIEALKSTVVEMPVTEVEENLSEPTFEVTEEEIYEPLKLPEEENFEEETSEEFENTEMEQPEVPFATVENEEIENEELEAEDEVNNPQTDNSLISQVTDEESEEFISIPSIILETEEEIDAEEADLNSEKNPLIENNDIYNDIYKEDITCSDNENLDVEESEAPVTPVEGGQMKHEDDLIINNEDKEKLLDKTITKERAANVFKKEGNNEIISQRKNKNSAQNLKRVKSKQISQRSKSAGKQDAAINKKLPMTGQDNNNILIGGLLALLGAVFINRRFKHNNKSEQ